MASGFDGTIRIDTSVNAKGMAQGTRNITSQLSGLIRTVKFLGAAVGVAFSGAAIFRFSKTVLEQFNLMQSSIGGNIKAISTAFDGLKGAFANVIAQLVIAFTPAILTVINWLTRLLQTLAAIIHILFGFKKGMGAVAESTKQAGKAAKGALAPFDQLNVLMKPEAGDPNQDQKKSLPELEIPDSLIKKVEDFKKKFMAFIEPVVKAFNELLVPAIQFVINKFMELLDWIEKHPKEFQKIIVIIGIVILVIAALAIAIWLIVAAMNAWVLISGVLAAAGTVIAGVFAFILSPVGLLIIAIIVLIALIVLFISKWEMLKEVARLVIDTTILALKILAKSLLENIIVPMREGFFNMLNQVKDKFISTFNTIKGFIKGIVNSILGFLDSMIQSIVSGINAVIQGANLVGGLAGASFTPVMTMTTPAIPRLATGAVIPPNAQFAAILGDQRSGKNIETPENLLRQIMREERGNMQADVTIRFEGSLSELVRMLKPAIDKENIRVGNTLVKGKASIS